MSKKKLVLDKTLFYKQKIGECYKKPNGLWYGFGDSWLDWCKGEMPEWVGEYFYFVDTGESNILVLRDICDVVSFYKKYSVDKLEYVDIGWMEFGNPIDWRRISEEYDGIEIPNYLWNCRMNHSWYYTWDVASGCIWNLDQVSISLKKEKKKLCTV